jgi:hypothetical protein
MLQGHLDTKLEDITAIDIESVQSEQMGEEEKQNLLTIASANWKHRPEIERYVIKTMLAAFEKTSRDSFSILNIHDKPVAFVRTSPYQSPDGTLGVWASSLNVDPNFQKLSLATAFGREVIDLIGKDQPVFADVLPDNDAGRMYVNELGFEIVGTITIAKDVQGNPIKSYLIERAQDNQETKTGQSEIVVQPIPKDPSEAIAIVESWTRQGARGVRYEKQNDGSSTITFEIADAEVKTVPKAA